MFNSNLANIELSILKCAEACNAQLLREKPESHDSVIGEWMRRCIESVLVSCGVVGRGENDFSLTVQGSNEC